MKDLIKKWWFWVIILIIVLAIAFSSIVFIGFSIINPDENIRKLSKDLQTYDNNITVYQSSSKNTILINSYSTNKEQATKKAEEVGKILGKYVEYLTVYSNVQFNFYTEEGDKTSFNFNIATKSMENESFEDWVLIDSVAHNKEQDKLKKIMEKQEEINTEIKKLEDKKASLNNEITNLSEEVIKLKGEPRTYPAGHLVAGEDIPLGKYKIYDGNSNFVVYSSSGNLQVNIILDSRYGVDEYIYTFKKGDKIQASSSFKLVKVE